jgi:hypothetical protein
VFEEVRATHRGTRHGRLFHHGDRAVAERRGHHALGTRADEERIGIEQHDALVVAGRKADVERAKLPEKAVGARGGRRRVGERVQRDPRRRRHRGHGLAAVRDEETKRRVAHDGPRRLGARAVVRGVAVDQHADDGRHAQRSS